VKAAPVSSLLKTPFFNRLRPARGCAGIFKHVKCLKMNQGKNHVFFALRVEKVREGLFQQTVST
jgi:hypothetical protein